MLTKKDYEEIAKVFAQQMATKADPRRVQMIKILAYGMADVCAARGNKGFDRKRFLQSCAVVEVPGDRT